MRSVTRRRVLQGAATFAGACASGRLVSAETAPGAGQRRSCYVNFAEHLLNAYNPNMIYPDLPNRWSDGSWRRFIDMIADFGFTHFEFWLVPRLFSRAGLEQPFGEVFTEQMKAIIAHGHEKGVGVKLLAALTTVGDDWHTHCPRVRDEWDEVVMLWDRWTKRLPGLGVVGIFPGDPGGCSRNGCTARTFIDGALEIAGVVKKNQPQAEVEIGTWGTPFWGWGTIEGPPGWKGEFIQSIQHSAWRFDKKRADESMTYLLRRLPDFPADSSVAINLAFNGDGDPDDGKGAADARPWAREIAKTNRVLTWDFSLTEGENAVMPHHRFGRLFAQRKRERAAAPYSGGICFTMTPLLNQLSLHQSARSFIDPDADPAVLARRFYGRLFGPAAEKLNDLLPLFEVIPDWGNYNTIDLPRAEYHARMNDGVELLRAVAGKADDTVPFQPAPEEYRKELLFFFELFRDLSGAAPDFDALAKRYWQRVYAIYDRLPRHVDPRPHAATERLIRFFDPRWTGPRSGPLPGKWTS